MTWNTLIINSCGHEVDVNGQKVASNQTSSLMGVHNIVITVPNAGTIQLTEPGTDNYQQYVSSTWAVKVISGKFLRYWAYEGDPTLQLTLNPDMSFTIPPNYGVLLAGIPINDTLPTYEYLAASLMETIGPDPTTAKVATFMAAVEQLPPYDASILAAGPPHGTQPLSPAQEAALATGMAKTLTSADAVPQLASGSGDAVLACTAINAMFTTLATMLGSIDARGDAPAEGPFAPRLAVISAAYRSVLSSSRDLAIVIANYGDSFDTLIVPVCCDSTLTIDQRKSILQGFINQAADFATRSTAIQESFNALVGQFATFEGSFTTWAVAKEGQLSRELIEAQKALGDLQEKLARLNTAMIAMGITAATSLPATGIIAWLSGPAAPFVIIGGLILAGLSTAAFIALSVEVANCKTEVAAQELVVKDIQAQIDDIDKARVDLTTLGDTSLQTFQTNIGLLSNYWLNAHNDALEIQNWLEQGANLASMPSYMNVAIGDACTIYKSLSVYLHAYANGVIIPPTPSVA